MIENTVKWNPWANSPPNKEGMYFVTVEFPFCGKYLDGAVDQELRVAYWDGERFYAQLEECDCRVTAWIGPVSPYIPERK